MLTYWQGHTLLLFLALCPVASGAVDLPQCLADVIICANSSSDCTLGMSNTTAFAILRTSQGRNVTSLDDATALSYTGCTQYCGAGVEQFSWTSFAQEFAAWLLPYLALVSQLPFGAQRRMDNFMSAILTLGSPTLAAYSLFMTLLNARWVNDQLFAGIDYPNTAVRRSVVHVLSSLQQVPLRVHPRESGRFEFLVVHPDNDIWWTILAEELGYSHRWSIASATSIAWVVVAFLLTVADSIYYVPTNINSNGQGTGSEWLWLLPIVVGWLVLSPKCDYRHVHDAYHKANKQVFVPDFEDHIAAPASAFSDFGLTIDHNPDWLLARDIVSPDELRIPPVFNYARIFSWYQNVYLTSLFYRAAWRKSTNRSGVDGRRITGNVHSDIPHANRLGTPEQIMRYCQPEDRECTEANVLWPRGLFSNMVVASLMSLQLQWGTTGAAALVVWFTPTIGLGCRSLAYLIYGALSTVVWMLLILSSALGYYAHHLLHDQPPFDLERDRRRSTLVAPSRTSSYDPKASPTDSGSCLSPEQTKIAIPLVQIHPPDGYVEQENVRPETDSATSMSFTTAKPHPKPRQVCGQIMSVVADWLRWIGKSLAIVNAIGIISNSIFQYAGVYTNCYCDSSVFSWGASAFNVIQPNSGDIDLARRAWIGGLALALCCCSFFVGSIYLVRDSLVL